VAASDPIEDLAKQGYQIVRIDAAAPETERDFLGAIGTALDFPDYYGHNLDALNDCLRDVVRKAYGWRPDATGLAIVFTGYEAARARWPRTAQRVLEIIDEHSRDAETNGDRLLCLT
jgi:RNAse (barnase) inhibitor barstar